MRYGDWTFRNAEVRFAEHLELRRALGLERVPAHTILLYVLRRLRADRPRWQPAENVRRLDPPRPGGSTVAEDGTGLAPRAIRTYLVKRAENRGDGFPAASGSIGWWR